VRLVGDLQSELVDDFFDGFAMAARGQRAPEGDVRPLEPSHKIEACFKAFAARLRTRARKTKTRRNVPSTKGLL
jgi:imidazoleglycerol-phosphate dehydratase